MQLIEHSYGGRKPARYYIDSRRVGHDAYHYEILINRIGNGQHSCFQTRVLCLTPGAEHTVHYSCLSAPRSS